MMSGMGIFFGDKLEFPESFHEVSDIPDSWDVEERAEILNILKQMDAHYPDYRPPKGVKVVDVEPDAEESSSKYWGRGEEGAKAGNASMRINKSRRIESVAHELGHDVEQNIFNHLAGSEMEIYTFKEFFADLNTLTFTDAEPNDRALYRAPFSPYYESRYQKAAEAVDPVRRDKEVRQFERLIKHVEDENYDKIDERLDLNQAPPYLANENPRDTGSQMLVDALADLDRLRQLKKDIWFENSLIQSRTSDEIGEFLLKKISESNLEPSLDSKINHYLFDLFGDRDKEFLGNNGFETVNHMMHKDLERAASISNSYLDWLEEGITAEDVFEELNYLTYGNDEFDYHVSLPHEVGGMVAEKQYQNGVRPVELVYAKDEWIEHLNDELLSTIENIYRI